MTAAPSPSSKASAAPTKTSKKRPATSDESVIEIAPIDTQTKERTFWANVNRPFAAGFFLTLGALFAVLLGIAISNLSTVMIYVVFALFAALGLDPVVRWLEGKGMSRVWGIVTVCLTFGVVIVGLLLIVVPTAVRQISLFISSLPGTIADFRRTDLYAWLLDASGGWAADLLSEGQKFITNPERLAAIGGGVVQLGAGIASGISGVVIIFVLALYFIASLSVMKTSFYQLFPARNREGVSVITEQITNSIGGYLAGMVTLAFFNAVVAFLLHLFIGLPFPALMAVIAFTITLIPLIGSVLFWGIASVLALFTSPVSAIIFAIAYVIYMQIEAYVITPRVMNRAISVPGSLVVIGALVGGTLLGLLGALVAIPVTASILLIIKQVLIPRQNAKK